MADDNHRQAFLGARETPAQRHAQLRHIEEVGGGRLAPDAFRLALAADGSGKQLVNARDPGEGFGLARRSVKSGPEKALQHSSRSVVCTVRSVQGLPTGAGRRTNRLTMEKMVAFAAMPRPIETTTARTKPGELARRRKVYVKSCCQ